MGRKIGVIFDGTNISHFVLQTISCLERSNPISSLWLWIRILSHLLLHDVKKELPAKTKIAVPDDVIEKAFKYHHFIIILTLNILLRLHDSFCALLVIINFMA